MNSEDLIAHLKTRRETFLHFRWLLFLWLGATAAYLQLQGQPQSGSFTILGLVLASQVGLWSLPLKAFEGLRIFYAIFLMDLNFMLMGFWYTGQMQPELMVVLFMGTFVSALGQRVSYAVLSTVVLSALYLSFKAKGAESVDLFSPQELLKFPFIFIASVHSGLLAEEAAAEAAAMSLIKNDRNNLAANLKSTFMEIARFNKEIAALLDALPFGILMLDSKGKVSFFNDMAEHTYGIRREQVLKFPLSMRKEVSYLEPYIKKGMDNPESDFQLIDIPSSEGAPWQMNLSTYPVLDSDEKAMGVLAVLSPLSYHESVLEHIEALKGKDGENGVMALLTTKPGFFLKLPELKDAA